MAHASLTQTLPEFRTFDPDPSETELRALYAHSHHSLRVGMIRSRDGKAAGPDGSSRSLNGPEDLRILRILRSLADVVIVGGRTARSEGYGDITLPPALAATRAHSHAFESPMLGVVTYSGDVPAGLTPSTSWVITTAGSPAHRDLGGEWKSRVIIAGESHLDPYVLTRELATRGASRILCEGGPEVASQLFADNSVSDYCLTTSSRAGGSEAPETPPVPPTMYLAHRLEGGDFVIERWTSRA